MSGPTGVTTSPIDERTVRAAVRCAECRFEVGTICSAWNLEPAYRLAELHVAEHH